MSIVRVSQLGAGRNGGFNKNFHRNYTVVKQVIVNDPYDGPATVVLASGFLLYGAYAGYENTADVAALCVDIKPDQDGDNWQKWRVVAQFTTNWKEQDQEQDPEEEPALFWIETEFANKPTTKEWDGTPIVNSAGQLISGLEKPLSAVETWVWEKNFSWLNRGMWKLYQNATNTDTVAEIEPYQGLLHIIVPKPSFRDGLPFYRVQFRVLINDDPDGWRVRPADVGTMFKNSAGKLEAPADNMGRRLDGQVMLKEDGSLELDATAEPRYLPAKHLVQPLAFSAIGLPFGQ